MKSKISNRYMYVTLQKEGIHCYPQAATDPNLADVSFLAFPHRHMFHIKITLQVFDNDRELEFIQVKRWTESLFPKGLIDLQNWSCEMFAEELIRKIAAKYCKTSARDIWVEVNEDGENGCILTSSGDFYIYPESDD